MKRLFVIAFLFCLYALSASAQIKYCMTYTDFKEGNWVEVDDKLSMTESTRAQKIWLGKNDVKIDVKNDSLEKLLKKEVFAILYQENLLINCRKIYYKENRFGKGYAFGYLYGKRILFVAQDPSEDSRGAGAALSGGLAFGVVGGLVLGSLASIEGMQKGYCFLVKHERRDGKIDVEMIDDTFMKKFEKKSPEFYDEYMSVKKKKKRESAAHVFPLFKDWQLIQ